MNEETASAPGGTVHIGYSKAVASVMIVLGALQLALALVTARGSALAIRLFPAGVCLLVGILYSIRPYFELRLRDRELVAPAALGPARKVYPFARLADVRVEGGALWIGGQKTGIRRWLANARDWAALVERLAREAAIPD